MGVKRSRDERKQLAAERRREQQARDRRQRRIVYGAAAPIALLIIAVVPITNWYHAHQRGKQHAVGYVHAVTTAARSAGCTGVRNDREMATSVIKSATTVDYAKLTAAAGNALPPSSGPRDSNPLPDTPTFYARTAAPAAERAVGNLDHGYVIAWYDSQLSGAQVTALQKAVSGNSRTLVVPWTRSVFSGSQHVVFTAWDRTQRCSSASAPALKEFADAYRDPPLSQRGWASPSAPTPNGSAGTGPKASTSAKPSASATPAATAPSASTSGAPTTSPTAAVSSPAAVTSSSLPKATVTPVR